MLKFVSDDNLWMEMLLNIVDKRMVVWNPVNCTCSQAVIPAPNQVVQ